jgi:hypothetical protein
MLKSELWISSVPQAELDRRARDARRRLERLEWLLTPYVAAKPMRSGRLPRLLGWRPTLRGFGRPRQGGRTRRPLGDRRPSAMPEIRRPCRAVGSLHRW